MKTMKNVYALMFGILLLGSCIDDNFQLDAPLDKSSVDYMVSQDLVTDPSGNTVILKLSTPGTIPIWDYGTGRSNRAQDTIHFAFKGDYVVKLSIAANGGIVECDPITVHVTGDNLMYVNDPMWSMLTGGVGNEKVW